MNSDAAWDEPSVSAPPTADAIPAANLPATATDRASVQSAVGAATIQLHAPGHRLENVFSAAAGGLQASDVALPYGLIGFQVADVQPGGIARVDLTLPKNAAVSGYWKQDPHTGSLGRFDFDGQTGAVVRGNTVTLFLRDGGRGDDDGTVNGVVVDPGGPGYGGSFPVVVGAQVTQVNFSGPDFISIEADPGTPSYSGPHWLDTEGDGIVEQSLPIGYPRGRDLVVSARFNATIQNYPFQPPTPNLMVRATSTASTMQPTSGLHVPATSVHLQGTELYLPPTTVSDPFGDTVNYGTLGYLWQFSGDGGLTWTGAGTTANELYVTLDTPATTSPVFHTLLDLSVPPSASVAAVFEAMVIAQTFTRFETRQVTDRHIQPAFNGRPLYYYKEWTNLVQDSATLLLGRDGTCYAFARLFVDAFRAAGAKTTPMHQVVFQAVRENGPANFKRREKFLVKDWYFNPDMAGSGTEDYPFANDVKYPENPDVISAKNAQDVWQYVWGPLESVSDLPGLPGQNTSNPPSIFDNHSMIKVNGVYFDPSYGKTWLSRQEWEDQAIAGFMDPMPIDLKYLFRSNPTGADTLETFHPYARGPLPYTPP